MIDDNREKVHRFYKRNPRVTAAIVETLEKLSSKYAILAVEINDDKVTFHLGSKYPEVITTCELNIKDILEENDKDGNAQ